jgi:competence protein ComEA
LDRRSGPEPLEIRFDGGQAGAEIQVHVTGAVVEPGVYPLRRGDRAIDALEAAGGPTDDADPEAINLARLLYDEDQVMVPRQGQATSSGGSASQVAGASTGRININTASAERLDTLPGIGEVYSQRIVDSRTNDGPFDTVDDLLERRLIPRATFEKIKELIAVGP